MTPVFPSCPLKHQGCWGFSFLVTGTYLSCCPAFAVSFLFSLSFSVSSTHLDTDRLGILSNWSSSDGERLKHFGVLLSAVNSIWISPMWIVLTQEYSLFNIPHPVNLIRVTRILLCKAYFLGSLNQFWQSQLYIRCLLQDKPSQCSDHRNRQSKPTHSAGSAFCFCSHWINLLDGVLDVLWLFCCLQWRSMFQK